MEKHGLVAARRAGLAWLPLHLGNPSRMAWVGRTKTPEPLGSGVLCGG